MQHDTPLVTVVTVVYNGEPYLEATIRSVLEQDYPQLEYLVIDGGSDDGTVALIKKYAERLAGWVSEPDGGVYDAMNKGIDRASGAWINFLNAGDTFAGPGTVSAFMDAAAPDDALLIGAVNYVVNGHGRVMPPEGVRHAFDGMFFCHQALFVRTSVMAAYRFDTALKIAADYDFALKCLKRSHRFRFLEQVAVNYRGGGLSERHELLNKVESLFVLSRYLDDPNDLYRSRTYQYLEAHNPHPGAPERLHALLADFVKQNYDRKRFILYGFGELGRAIYAAYTDNVLMVVDRNYRELNRQRRPDEPEIRAVEALADAAFDYVLISVTGREAEIKADLSRRFGIAEERMLTLSAGME